MTTIGYYFAMVYIIYATYIIAVADQDSYYRGSQIDVTIKST